MSRSATIVLVFLALGLAVYVGLTGRWRFSIERTIQPGSALFDFDRDDIRHISIKNGDQSFRIKREEEGWVLETANPDAAAPEAVEAIFKTALSTPVIDRIDPSEIRDRQNLSTYGVLKSSLQLDFKGDKPLSLLFGKNSADGNRTYVSFEKSKAVYLIPNDLAKLITLPPDSFRDRRLAPIDPDRILRIEIHRGPTKLELENTGHGWRIVKPLDAPADNKAVAALLQKWSTLRLGSFAEPAKKNETSQAPFEPKSEIRIFSENRDTPCTIAIGEAMPDDTVPVRLQPRGIGGTAPAALAQSTAVDIDQIRDRSLARLNPDLVDLVRWRRGGSKKEIRRGLEGWNIPPDRVEAIFRSLQETKVLRFTPATPSGLAEAGLDQPAARLDFLSVLSENTPETLAGEHAVLSLQIGAPRPDGSLPVRIEGAPEIAFVPADFLKALPAE